MVGPALLIALATWIAQPPMPEVASGLLTATSILTGFTFSMATTFWNKTIEARRDPRWAADSRALNLIDSTRNHLIWTVFIGVLCVAVLAIFALFGHSVPPEWFKGTSEVLSRGGSVVAGFLVFYLVTLVADALRLFHRIIPVLKA